MIILADENIPLAAEAFAPFGEVRGVEARQIDRAAAAECDVLLVRSVTRVDADLLRDSRVRFVGSATIGTDHVDLAYLTARRIAFAHAPGSNAASVCEYVLAALLDYAASAGAGLDALTLGVVGYGNIGRRLARRAGALGLRVLVNDPPLAERGDWPEGAHAPESLDVLLRESDVLTLHVPLTPIGRHSTLHLFDLDALAQMKPTAVLINTSRGGVVRGEDLLRALGANRIGAAILDVFEDEPEPDIRLVARSFIATPHIAGYSFDGKLNGTRMLRHALAHFLNREDVGALEAETDVRRRLRAPHASEPVRWLSALVRQMYDIRADDARFRETLRLSRAERGDAFTRLRKHYPVRRAFQRYEIAANQVPDSLRAALEQGLCVQLR